MLAETSSAVWLNSWRCKAWLLLTKQDEEGIIDKLFHSHPVSVVFNVFTVHDQCCVHAIWKTHDIGVHTQSLCGYISQSKKTGLWHLETYCFVILGRFWTRFWYCWRLLPPKKWVKKKKSSLFSVTQTGSKTDFLSRLWKTSYNYILLKQDRITHHLTEGNTSSCLHAKSSLAYLSRDSNLNG